MRLFSKLCWEQVVAALLGSGGLGTVVRMGVDGGTEEMTEEEFEGTPPMNATTEFATELKGRIDIG